MSEKFPSGLYSLFKSPDETLSKDQWVASILDGKPSLLKLRRNKLALFEQFPPEYVDYYQALQQEIAQRIPSEQDRPFICLNIRGNNRVQDAYNADLGLAGGTGPLSDALILENLVKNLSQIENQPIGDNRKAVANRMANFSAVLYSLPPPRDKLHALKDLNTYRHIYKSVRKRLPCSSLHILTNTGHSQQWVFASRLFFGSKRFGPVEDMTVKVAHKIQMETQPGEKVLILGTVAADKGKLYANLLAKRNLDPRLPSGDYAGVSAKLYLQSIIDRAKEGKVNENMPSEDRTCGQAFIDLVLHLVKQTDSKAVLFGCTELPLILQTKVPPQNTSTYFEVLQEQLANNAYTFYDSEAIFIEEMAKKSLLLQVHPTMRSAIVPELTDPEHDLHVLLNEIKHDIEKHSNRFAHKRDEKHSHKRNALLATLDYLETGDIFKLRQVLRENPRYDDASMIWGSTTLALVLDSVDVMSKLQTKSRSRYQMFADKSGFESKMSDEEKPYHYPPTQ